MNIHSILGIIHKISCEDCLQSYVGQSGRSQSHHMREAVSQGDCNASALVENSLTTGHEIHEYAWL